MNRLYLECYSGISGDMFVASLIDLGASVEVLENALKSIPIQGFESKITRVSKSGIDACDFNVILNKKYNNHDHDMKYLYGDNKQENLGENHNYNINNGSNNHEEKEILIEDYNINNHLDNHEEKEIINLKAHNRDHHEHRGLEEIIEIINNTDITKNAKKIAIKIFKILGKAEAKAHGVEISEVHFHEVGAIDSIVDIIAAAVCLDNLNISEVIVPVLYEGIGFIRCQHGVIPVPVPAVVNIVSECKLNISITSTEGELITPTGAAIVAAISTSNKLPEKFSISKIGIGAGKRNYEKPSILRVMIIENISNEYEACNIEKDDYIYKLESNIDDCSGEALGFVMERLFEAKARDVYYTPVFMKKNRPAYKISVICKKEDIENIEEIIFKETTTIGIRKQKVERTILKREVINMKTSLGEVQVKVCELSNGKRIYPEYSSIVEICKSSGLSYQEVYDIIRKEVNL